jgi:hypothetical protein
MCIHWYSFVKLFDSCERKILFVKKINRILFPSSFSISYQKKKKKKILLHLYLLSFFYFYSLITPALPIWADLPDSNQRPKANSASTIPYTILNLIKWYQTVYSQIRHTSPDGIFVFCLTRAPAATIAFFSTTTPSSRIAPIPTKASSSTVQPCKTALWPAQWNFIHFKFEISI